MIIGKKADILFMVRNRRFLFIADQIMHIGFLLIMTQMYFPFSTFNFPLNINSVILFVTAVILVTNVAAVVIQVFIARWDSRTEPNEKQSEGLEKAGFYIGILERLLVFSFIVLNHWEGVGFLLAAKSIFRFGDLSKSKDRKLTEYILIGTLLSFGFAMAAALLYLNIKQWII